MNDKERPLNNFRVIGMEEAAERRRRSKATKRATKNKAERERCHVALLVIALGTFGVGIEKEEKYTRFLFRWNTNKPQFSLLVVTWFSHDHILRRTTREENKLDQK